MIAQPLPQPTLPKITLDDDETSSVRTRGAAPSTYTGTSDYYSERKDYGLDYPPMDYPPMPAFAQPYGHQYNGSVGTLPSEDQHYDDNDYGSTAHLALTAAPYADDYSQTNNMFAPQAHGAQSHHGLYAYNADPHAAYRGASPANADAVPQYRGPSPAPSQNYDHAFEDGHGQAYPQQYQQYPQHNGHDVPQYGYPATNNRREDGNDHAGHAL
jgi:hypothetical protein